MSWAIYRRLGRRHVSQNRLNALHIALENRMTPLEAAEVADRLLAMDPVDLPVVPERAEQARGFAKQMKSMLGTAGKQHAEGFVRRRIARQMVLLSDPGHPTRNKMLVIGFAGRSNRLNMPLAPLLQHFDARAADLLLIFPPDRDLHGGFRRGFSGLGPDALSCIDRLPGLVPLSDYRSAAAFGTSGGALPAIATGLRLGLARVLAVSPYHVEDPAWHDLYGRPLAQDLQALAAAGPIPQIHVAFAPQHRIDRAAAEALAAILPVRQLRINFNNLPGAEQHVVLGHAMTSGKLGQVFGLTLFAEG